MSKQAIVIFGATGNLTYKKLIPALDALIEKKYIKDNDRIFMVARRSYDLSDYIEEAKKQVSFPVKWNVLEKYLHFVRFNIETPGDYVDLKHHLAAKNYDEVIFYLALPPELFPVVAKGISTSQLVTKGDSAKRVVFEKPFGSDLQSAKQINQQLWQYFDESQIYRIDHYLGKEMIQNILVVRFANKIFEQTWNHKTIRNIIIMAKETEGVMSRGNYYDKIGALKDMLQSHLLQMAALIAMSKPASFSSEDIKDAKVKVLKDLEFDIDEVVFGQYEGYLHEDKIRQNSKTDTLIFAKAHINNNKWNHMPIYFLTGKKLDEKRSEIIVNFKDDKSLLDIFDKAKPNNTKLVIKVAPEAGVKFQLNVKQAGLTNEIVTGQLDYCHTCKTMGNTAEAYEKLMLDLIQKNKTLFTRWDEIETMWEIVDKIEREAPLIYKDYQHIRKIIYDRLEVDIHDL